MGYFLNKSHTMIRVMLDRLFVINISFNLLQTVHCWDFNQVKLMGIMCYSINKPSLMVFLCIFFIKTNFFFKLHVHTLISGVTWLCIVDINGNDYLYHQPDTQDLPGSDSGIWFLHVEIITLSWSNFLQGLMLKFSRILRDFIVGLPREMNYSKLI